MGDSEMCSSVPMEVNYLNGLQFSEGYNNWIDFLMALMFLMQF